MTFADKVFFCNSGAEACEGAIKLARRYHFANGHPERWRIITFKGAFHGRTLATIAAAGNEKYLEGFGGPRRASTSSPFGDLEAVEKADRARDGRHHGRAGAGRGRRPRRLQRSACKGLRELCDKHGLLLVLDEVQSGMGRTGKLFAHEWAGITPDVMAIAKGIGGGFPLGAFLATEEAAKGMVPGTHGSTYGGNPLAMAVGNAVLDVVLEPGFLEHVQRDGAAPQAGAGAASRTRTPTWSRRCAAAACWPASRSSRRWATWWRACMAEKLLTVGAGENVVRLLPPLNVTEAEIARGRAAPVAGAEARLPRPQPEPA